MDKVLVGIAVVDWRDEFVQSYANFRVEMNSVPKNYQISFASIYRNQLDVAQNRLAEEAVKGGYTHLLLIEDDLYNFKKVHLDKLLQDDLDVIGAAYFGSTFPHDLIAMRKFDPKEKLIDVGSMAGKHLYCLPADKCNGVQEVDLMGFGFTLIKTSVFSMIEKPYFDMTHEYNSDAYFYDKCHKSNIKTCVDFSVVLNHRGVTPENRNAYYQIGMIDKKYDAMLPESKKIFDNEEEAKQYEAEVAERIKIAEEERAK